MKIVFNQSLQQFRKRVTVNFADQDAYKALMTALSGTGLVSERAPGNVLVITTQKSGRAEISSQSQAWVLTGRVIDSATNTGLGGVTVSVVGTDISVLTGKDGSFRITGKGERDKGYSLSARLLGYRNTVTEVDVKSGASVTIVMSPAATSLNEVVTTATGQQRRVEVPVDIVKIDPGKIMERAPVNTLTDLLEAAQVPGVYVTRANGNPGAPSRIRIRGLRSVTQSNDPVVIVDGNWIDATVGSPSAIDDIDPSVIEKVEIVRGPSASTLYGQDAANGVIVITTKRGKAGPTRWTTRYQKNWGQTYGRMPLVYHGYGYSTSSGNLMRCHIDRVLSGTCIQDSVLIHDPNHPLLAREGTQTVHNLLLGVSGGTRTTTYSISGTKRRTIGVRRLAPVDLIRMRILDFPIDRKFFEPSKADINSINTGLILQPSDKMTINLTINASQTGLRGDGVGFNLSEETLHHGPGASAYSLDTLSFIGNRTTISINESPTARSNILLGSSISWRVLNGGVINFNSGVSRSAIDLSSFSRIVYCYFECSDTLGTRVDRSEGRGELTARMNMSRNLSLGRISGLIRVFPSLGADYRKSQMNGLSVTSAQIPPGQRTLHGAPREGLSLG